MSRGARFVQRYVQELDDWFEFDRVRGEFTNPNVHGASGKETPAVGVQIIRDIEPYKTVATDIACKGRTVIGGRRQHKEFLKRNGYFEVGNEFVAPRREELPRTDRVSDIKRAIGD